MATHILSQRQLLHWPAYAFGSGVIALAVATHFLALDLKQVFSWLELAFGPVYLSSYIILVLIGSASVVSLNDPETGPIWLETGLQAASGIATLALTFTLLGISLGIESLSEKEISPDTIQLLIADLTRHFSMAFLTTIVGLPTANILRSVLSIRWAYIEQVQALSKINSQGATP